MKNYWMKLMCIAVATLTLAACSTTSRLGSGETLYTGVKELKYKQDDSVKIATDVQDAIFTTINVKPNNPLYSPYYRTPFPIGLWVYNHWDENATGLKGWLYKKLVAEPKLISYVRPATRVDMINTLLRNNGYFGSSAKYTLNYSKSNRKKASISYQVWVHKPYVIGKISPLGTGTPVSNFIDSCARASNYYRTGSRYCLDSLNQVRIDIANALRDNGYYFFRPEYIQYVADSLTTKGVVNMQMTKASNIPNSALVRYYVNNVTVTVLNNDNSGTPDTLETPRCTLVKYVPIRLRDASLLSCIRGRKGRPFKVGNMDRMQVQFSNLGIFSNVDMKVTPLDSTNAEGNGLLDLAVTCTLDKPIEANLQVQGAYKSNSFLGPGLKVGMTHKNLFGGGERFSADVRASYEWQTGKGGAYKNSEFNSYEFGYNVELSVPRLLAPRFVDRSRRYVNWTRVSQYASILNRPDYFKMLQLGIDFTWQWHSNRHTLNEFTPFRLVYSKLLSTTQAMDEIMSMNPVVKNSFNNTYIPSMGYSFTYTNDFGRNSITCNIDAKEAGNVFAGIWEMCGSKNDKKLFGTPFSQFFKIQTQLVWKFSFTQSSQLVSRLLVGAAHAYGNSAEVPYSEQFYSGGANSVRAFTIRSIGPGSYRASEEDNFGYYDQTGTFKFENNWEYRFPILGYLHGAIFLDAGNVWLLKNDPEREGGKLTMKKFFDQLAVGTGLGLRFDMSMIVVRADLGIGIHAPYDTGKSGYYNIAKFKDGLAFHLAIGYPF